MPRIVELIYTNQEHRGKGVEGDPHRCIEQWFEKDGSLVFEKDHCIEKHSIEYRSTETDRSFLYHIYDRLKLVHNESENLVFMQRFKEIIDNLEVKE